MAKKITSRPGLFGNVDHYDAQGRKAGSSWGGSLFTDHYDAAGDRRGRSRPGLFGDTETTFDED